MLSALFQRSGIDVRDVPFSEQDPNWKHLITQAAMEGVLPALNTLPLVRQFMAGAPAEIQQILVASESMNAERNEAILAEAVHAATLLNDIGIQPVALKGLAYLLTSVYPNLGARYLLDIDLLLPADHIPKAVTHLFQNGYFESESATFLPFRHHHPAIRRPGSPAFEFHHQLVLGRHTRLLPPALIFARARPLNYNGANFLVPSPTDLANHLILHSQIAHPYSDRIFPPLRALLDLAYLQARFGDQIDWRDLARTYKENGQSATLLLHLHHAHQALDLPVPPTIPTSLPFFLKLRYKRRQLLNREPRLRLIDPVYVLMTLFGRRLRLLPLLLRDSSSWLHLIRLLGHRHFYRNLLR